MMESAPKAGMPVVHKMIVGMVVSIAAVARIRGSTHRFLSITDLYEFIHDFRSNLVLPECAETASGCLTRAG